MRTFVVKVAGMDCAEEVSVLRREVEAHSEAEGVSFDLLLGAMSVTIDDTSLTTDQILAAMKLQAISNPHQKLSALGLVESQRNGTSIR